MVGPAIADFEVDSLSGSRFDLALERFRDGHAFAFRGVAFALRDGVVECVVPSTWQLDRVTEEFAARDLERADSVFALLMSGSERFKEATRGFPHQVLLVDDYGNGSVEICRRRGAGKIIWNRK
jgi:hypothetical protein